MTPTERITGEIARLCTLRRPDGKLSCPLTLRARVRQLEELTGISRKDFHAAFGIELPPPWLMEAPAAPGEKEAAR